MTHTMFVNKQAILDESNNIFAYVLDYASFSATSEALDTCALLATIFEVGLKNLVRERLALLPISQTSLFDTELDNFADSAIVLCLNQFDRIDETLLARIKSLKTRGFGFALYYHAANESTFSQFKSIAPLCDYIIIDFKKFTAEELEDLALTFQKLSVETIAVGVHDQNSKALMNRVGFGNIGGAFFTEPVNLQNSITESGYIEVLELLNTLEEGHSIDEIASRFATSALITYQLLQFLNSPSFGLKQSVKSIRHALMMIGRKDLRKWLLLLALEYASGDSGGETPLTWLAHTRINIVNHLIDMSDALPESIRSEAAFVAVLSLLSAFMNVSNETLFDSISVDASIKEAVMQYQGMLGALLELCIATERHDIIRIAELLKQLDISSASYQQALLNGYQRK